MPESPLTEVRMFGTSEASTSLLSEIRTLLNEAFDGGFSDDDWDHALGGRHVIAIDGSAVLSHAAVVQRVVEVEGRRVHTGYLEGVGTAVGRQGDGLGSLVVTEASKLVRADFEMGALSTGRQAFYERLGWERWRGPTFVRGDSVVIRTPDDDDGVMALRFGSSSDLDLSAPIICETRSGDVW